MMDQQAHMHAVLADGPLRLLQNWFWDWNFRGYGGSTFAPHADWLFFWIFAISTFFFVLLMVLMLYFTFRYRRRPGVAPLRSRSHNTALELTWSIVPTIILVWMFFEGFRGYANMAIAPATAPEIVITGQMWSWSAMYPNGGASAEATRRRQDSMIDKDGEPVVDTGVQETPIFVVPEAMPIKLRMHSLDVIHAFWIPDFRAKFDLYPNRYTTLWFESTPINREKAERNGWELTRMVDQDGKQVEVPVRDAQGDPVYFEDHWVFCAEYCGRMHSEMSAIIRVVPRDQYNRILEEWATPRGSPWNKGRALARIKGCFGCHSIDGTQQTGPTWRGLFGTTRDFTDGSTAIADENYIRKSILEPGSQVVAGFPNVMQPYHGRITDDEINSIIAFIRSPNEEPPTALPPEEGEGEGGEGEAGGAAPRGEGASAPQGN